MRIFLVLTVSEECDTTSKNCSVNNTETEICGLLSILMYIFDIGLSL